MKKIENSLCSEDFYIDSKYNFSINDRKCMAASVLKRGENIWINREDLFLGYDTNVLIWGFMSETIRKA